MSLTKQIPLAACVLVAGLIASGCAVLTVDVDVYKGPLSNSEETQSDQVISLAMGAKPLLIQLRDHLAVGEPPHPVDTKPAERQMWPQSGSLQKRLTHFRNEDWYSADQFAEANQKHLRNEFALRVNDILGLYRNTSSDLLMAYVIRAKAWAASYAEHFETLHPANNTAGKRLWEVLSAEMDKSPGRTPAPDAAKQKKRDELKEAYGKFFSRVPAVRFQAAILKDRRDDQSSNRDFRLLLEEQFDKDGEQLFLDPDSPAKKAFLEYVKKTAQAYFDAREDLRRLMRLAIEAGADAQHSPHLSPETQMAARKAAADLAASLINLKVLAAELTNHHQHLPIGPLRLKLGAALESEGAHLTLTNVATGKSLNARDWQAAEGVLAELLKCDDGELAHLILCLDSHLACDGTDEHKYGLTRGPASSGRESAESSPNDIKLYLVQSKVDDFAAVSGSLGRGRRSRGLEMLIETYFKNSASRESQAERMASADYRELLAALVDFAQKIVTLGNNATLFRGGNGSEVQEYVSVLQTVGNSIIVQVDELKARSAHHDQLKRKSSLVGNAIHQGGGFNNAGFDNWPSQTNSFDAKDAAEQLVTLLRTEYIKALREGGGKSQLTNFSVTTIALPDATNVSGRIDGGLSAGNTHITNSVTFGVSGTAAANAIITVTNDFSLTGSADKYLEAIKAATELRAGMIYLRPASSFLRSSYPASTLQRNRSLAWRNMLQEHGMRQVPLIGGVLSGEVGENTRTIAEIDQQSWQSINRVRVTGAGSANYAVAKDDVGNWYVKSYSTITSNLHNSMRNLAMFSAGNTLGGQLPIRRRDGTVIRETNMVLAVQFNQAHLKYTVQTSNTFERLIESATNLATSVIRSWGDLGTNSTSAENLCTNHFTRVIEAVTSASARATKLNESEKAEVWDQETLRILRAVKRYHNGLNLAVEQSAKIDGSKKFGINQALTHTLRDFLEEFFHQRERALESFESALDVINGAASAK